MGTRKTYKTTVETLFIAKRESTADSPGHFEWLVSLKREAGAGLNTRTLPFKMGLGHIQTKCGKRIQGNLRVANPVASACAHERCFEAGPQPTPPDLYDVLCALKADATNGLSFEDWCGDYGFDADSRKALEMYLACQKSERDSAAFFGFDWLPILEDESYT